MHVTSTVKLGNSSFAFLVDESKEMEALHKAIVLGNPPCKCELCGNSEHFKFDSNKDKAGNIYVNVVCRKCGAKAKLGQYQAGGYFWHKFEKYQKQAEPTQTNQGNDAPPPGDSDLPF